MLDELGKIIDGIYGPFGPRRPKKKVVFLIGNGIRQVSNVLNDDQVKREASKRGYSVGTAAYRDFKWRLFEYARYHTANGLPSFAHCCIHRMVLDGVCDHVITTNYDLYFDSIWKKSPNLKVALNPIATKQDYRFGGYYSLRKRSAKARCYWKIHGSLSHGVFRSKKAPQNGILVSLPRCAIATNRPKIASAYGLKTTCPFLGYEATTHSGTHFPDHDDLDDTFEPFIDWTYHNRRDLFAREIGAVKKILANSRNVEAIILVGFRGYYNPSDPNDPWNEELVPPLERLIAGGFSNVFLTVHDNQAATLGEPTSRLMRERFSSGKGISYVDAALMMRELLSRHSNRFPYALVDSEFAKWANYYYLPGKERAHV